MPRPWWRLVECVPKDHVVVVVVVVVVVFGYPLAIAAKAMIRTLARKIDGEKLLEKYLFYLGSGSFSCIGVVSKDIE